MDEVMKLKGRTRTDASVGASLGKDFWKKTKVHFPEGPKEQVTMRFDAEVLKWFKSKGRGYQTRMNAVLRSYYEVHNEDPAPER